MNTYKNYRWNGDFENVEMQDTLKIEELKDMLFRMDEFRQTHSECEISIDYREDYSNTELLGWRPATEEQKKALPDTIAWLNRRKKEDLERKIAICQKELEALPA